MSPQYNILIAQHMGRSIRSETYCLMLYFVIEDKTVPSVGLLPPKQDYLDSSQHYKANTISNPQMSITCQQRYAISRTELSAATSWDTQPHGFPSVLELFPIGKEHEDGSLCFAQKAPEIQKRMCNMQKETHTLR